VPKINAATPLAGCLLACFATVTVAEAPESPVLLWPNGAPGALAAGGEESVRTTDQGERVVSNVHAPSLTVYLPKPGGLKPAVIVVPGGGHRELWTDHEGHNVARFLADNGIAAFVLKYRLARAPGSSYGIETHALDDLKRAIRSVRSRAAEWSVDPAKVGAIGFSAGGQLVALSVTRFDAGDAAASDPVDRMSSRPDFGSLVYAGTWPDLPFGAETPPLFLLCGTDDRPQVLAGLTRVYLALQEAKVPAELHFYDGVPHGFGLRASNTGPVTQWPRQFIDWLRVRKIL
jgi:acetyl esterase/lipase